MELVLKITSYHRLSPEIKITKKTQSSLTFGRSQNCDWHLPNPEKIISSNHGKIARENGKYYVYDNSTNGVFLNFSVSPIGAGNKHVLNNGDVLSIGDFQIEASLKQLIESANNQTSHISQQPKSSNIPLDNLKHSINEPTQSSTLAASPNLNEYMEAPKLSTLEPQSVIQIPEDWDDLALMGSAQSSMQTESKNAVTPKIEPQQIKEELIVPPVSQSVPVKVAPANNSNNNVESNTLTQAFLKGLNINDELASNLSNEQLWFEMGNSLNLLLIGVMDILRQRTTVKNQLKLNHTMFQTQQNNPLKFSATIDDVMQSLFVRKSSSFLSFEESIKEVFSDTKSHERALIAGASGVLEGILDQLSPHAIKQQATEHASVAKFIPGQLDAKSWSLFLQLHNDLSEQINTKGAMALSDDFLKAYEHTSK